MLARAWERVKSETIANCFRACGFVSSTVPEDVAEPAEVARAPDCEVRNFEAALGGVSFDEYVGEDNGVEICGTFTDQEIVEIVRPHELVHESDSDDSDIEPEPKAADVGAALAVAERFFAGESNAEEALAHVRSFQNLVSATRFGKVKQTKVTDFFR